MVSQNDKRSMVKVGAIALALAVLVFFLYPIIFGARAGFNLDGQMVITYEDGTSTTASTSSNLLDKLTVIQSNGKTIRAISIAVNGKWISTPSGQSAKVQYLIVYYIEVTGPYYFGARTYDILTGFHDWPYGGTSTQTRNTNFWQYVANNIPIVSTSDFTARYYAQKGSGLQTGNLNIPMTMAQYIVQSLKGVPVAEPLSNFLITGLGTETVQDQQVIPIIQWSRAGSDFYVDLKRTSWDLPVIHLGDIASGGLTDTWLRMNEGDSYTIKFHTGYIFRFQDKTGEWSAWKDGDVVIATLSMQCVQGYFVNMGLQLGGTVVIGV